MRRRERSPNHFEDFYKAFTSSAPSKAALRERRVSTKAPGHYLQAAHRQAQGKQDVVIYPPHIQALKLLQRPNGRWEFTERFRAALYNYVPEPPEDIPSGKWATAIAVVVLGRVPEYFDVLEDIYVRGREHVDEPLCVLARGVLPPIPCPYDVNPNVIRAGKWNEWKEAFQNDRIDEIDWKQYDKQFEHQENKHAISDDDISMDALTQEFRQLSKSKKEVVHESLKSKLYEATHPNLRAFRVDKTIESCWRRSSRWSCAERMKTYAPARISRVYESGNVDVVYLNGLKEKEFNVKALYIRKLNHDPISESLSRLGTEWQQPFYQRYETKKASEMAKKSVEWDSTTNISKITKVKRKRKAFKDRERVIIKAEMIQDPKIEYAQSKVVGKALEYDNYLVKIKRELDKSSKNYRRSRVHVERMRAFKTLTTLLRETVQVMVEIVQLVSEWRNAIVQSPFRDKYVKRPPFMWNGKNLLTELISTFNFLSKSESLTEYHGQDFTFVDNPFLRAVPLRSRPVTPRCAERTVYINGQSTTEISESLLRERTKELAAVQQVNEIIEQGATWWPEAGYTFALKREIRQAEKELLLEATFAAQSVI